MVVRSIAPCLTGFHRRPRAENRLKNYCYFFSFPPVLLVNEDTSPWGPWFDCDVKCGGGRKHRYRTNCTTISRRAADLKYCVNSTACNLQPCPPGMFIQLFVSKASLDEL